MRITTTEQGVPVLSQQYIEQKAEEVIEYFYADTLVVPQRIPLIKIIDQASTEFKLMIDYSLDLGATDSGNKIHGKYILSARELYVDISIFETMKFPFTAAHEFGHFVLHRKCKLNKVDFNPDKIIDTSKDFITGKPLLTSAKDWIEWQANTFAAAFLMPSKLIREALIKNQEKRDIKRNLGIVYLENEPSSKKIFYEIRHVLAELFGVSPTHIWNRLDSLKLIEDNRYKNSKHISELLSD